MQLYLTATSSWSDSAVRAWLVIPDVLGDGSLLLLLHAKGYDGYCFGLVTESKSVVGWSIVLSSRVLYGNKVEVPV